jgi:hypothetical protein
MQTRASGAPALLRLLVPAFLVALAVLALNPAASLGQAMSLGTSDTYPAGWNLISFGDSTSFSGNPNLVGPLYTFDRSGSYRTTDLQHVEAGAGYWAYFSGRTTFNLLPSTKASFVVTVPAGACVMVGNPSTSASVRVLGADHVYVYSASTGSYTDENLLGIGRGAWACNGSAADEQVSVVDRGLVNPIDWPGCCDPEPYSGNGSALLIFNNASAYPLAFGGPPIDAQGNRIDNNVLINGVLPGCPSCSDVPAGGTPACGSTAESASVVVPAGRYFLHLQSDGPYVPDAQAAIDVKPGVSYAICFSVSADRPQ